jgi:hypothetical protein
MTKKIYWGKPMWQSMHYVALKYPQNPTNEEKMNYMNYYKSIGDILPCPPCRKHYKKMLEDHPMNDEVMQSNDTLFAWTVFLHNKVNQRLGKKIYTVEEAKKLYTNPQRKKCTWIIWFIVILILIGYIIKQKCKKK